ncbi:hypothetical protein Hanom_Chr16g01424201 [Helianthus anomalus]
MELEAGSKLAKKTKHQGVKWLFLKVWRKTVKVTKPQGAKRKFTLFTYSYGYKLRPFDQRVLTYRVDLLIHLTRLVKHVIRVIKGLGRFNQFRNFFNHIINVLNQL